MSLRKDAQAYAWIIDMEPSDTGPLHGVKTSSCHNVVIHKELFQIGELSTVLVRHGIRASHVSLDDARLIYQTRSISCI